MAVQLKKDLVLSSDNRSVKVFLVLKAWHEGGRDELHQMLFKKTLLKKKKPPLAGCICHDMRWDLSPLCLFF